MAELGPAAEEVGHRHAKRFCDRVKGVAGRSPRSTSIVIPTAAAAAGVAQPEYEPHGMV